jgi:hypothetical protein
MDASYIKNIDLSIETIIILSAQNKSEIWWLNRVF